ncbi:MAG: NAD-dependent protein deacylase [Lachnospiraceae bacterium]|nr:NAD-dependent protein deacylase [Lachnospiraceae bacterium]
MDGNIRTLTEWLRESDNIVFFGGAGVSTASNIPDFRSSNGLYVRKLNRQCSPEEMVSHTFLVRHTEEFFDFYKKYLVYPEAKPNPAHYALAELEEMGKLKAIVTQNIDGLHQMAGSKEVYEIHGTVHKNYCVSCGKQFDADYVMNCEGVPKCDACGHMVRPDVVLYEEGLSDWLMSQSVRAIRNADMLIIGGTSLVVYPAAGLIQYFRGKKLVLINKSETPADSMAGLVIHDDIAKVLREAVDGLKEDRE